MVNPRDSINKYSSGVRMLNFILLEESQEIYTSKSYIYCFKMNNAFFTPKMNIAKQ